MIERSIARLTAAKPKRGDAVPPAQRPEPVMGSLDHQPSPNADFQRTATKTFKTAGPATVGQAHDFGWMPQTGIEARAIGRTAQSLGNVSGNRTLKIEYGAVYEMTLTGATTFTFDVASAIDPYGRSGIDIDFRLLIDNAGGYAINMPINRWGPRGTAPLLNRVGFYEFDISYLKTKTKTIIRAHPIVMPQYA